MSDPIVTPTQDDTQDLDVPKLDDATVADRVADVLEALLEVRTTDALDLARDLMREDPNRAEPYYLIGLASAQFGDAGRAATLIRHAHERSPDCKDYADVLSVIYTRIGNLTEGLYFAKLATALEPHPFITSLVPGGMDAYFEALQQIEPNRYLVDVMVAFNQREFARASEYCGMALRIDGKNVTSHILVGRSLLALHEPDRAAAAFHAAIHLEPDNMTARIGLAECLDSLNRQSEADAVRSAALKLDPDDVSPAQAIVRALPYRSNVTTSQLHVAEDEVSARLGRIPSVAEPDLLGGAPIRMNAKKRIGYIGGNIFDGPDATFFRDVVSNHDRSQVEVYVYQESVTQSDMVTYLQVRTDGWREIYDLDADVVASIIAGDGIDALVDLGGYAENMPLPALAIKPAAVQVGWFNHIDGSAGRAVDLILSDPTMNDLDDVAHRDNQSIAILDNGMLALQPPEIFGPVSDLPALEANRITFGAAANLTYVNAEVARIWSEILNAIPDSRLVLRAMVSDSDIVTDRIVDLFAHFGTVDRIHFFRSESETRIDADFFDDIDIHLDPFPVSRPEDVALALWAGVPSVTMKGPTRLGRLGASVLHSAGQSDWITDTPEAYVEVAATLARKIDALAGTRKNLRKTVKDTALFNPGSLARAIEGCVSHVLSVRDGSTSG